MPIEPTQAALIAACYCLCEHVNAHLPDGWKIVMEMWRGEASIELRAPNGTVVTTDTPDYGVSVLDGLCEIATELESTEDDALYLIETLDQPGDLRLWWNPNQAGYTTDIEKAGRYSPADAIRICREGDNRMWLYAEVAARSRHVVPR